ncbi:serine/threonine-protein kinase 19 [Strongylocentrotus purpuratus]|uniref:Serine/threonine-protein kinase 19 n=1 Tax=Strongylocentrotus purpuratus TaxID=7668 RepID=A0A7M7SY45_STRPU|nr:serine/threonine-protein kinase 19 [Strongylocentrotus purpuratus]
MKRAFMPSLFKNKRPRTVNILAAESAERQQLTDGAVSGDEDLSDLPSDTKAALTYLRSLFDVHRFEGRIPPILLKHQLYSVIQNKTQVDREVDQLRDKKEIKIFRYGKDGDEFCIVFTADYISHVRKIATQQGVSALIDRFIPEILEKMNNITFSRQTLCDVHGFKDKEITMLVIAGMLTVRDVGSWWLSIPGAGIFMKNFSKGRQSVLRAIKKAKYREILQKELEERKLQAVKKLSMMYHIHDVIGAELVTKIKTTSGIILRLDE